MLATVIGRVEIPVRLFPETTSFLEAALDLETAVALRDASRLATLRRSGVERKRMWRVANPARSRDAERQRAQARRQGNWGAPEPGVAPRLCTSHDSYWRYECSGRRFLQRINWPTIGAGSMRMTLEERKAARKEHFEARKAELLIGLDPETAEWLREFFDSRDLRRSERTQENTNG